MPNVIALVHIELECSHGTGIKMKVDWMSTVCEKSWCPYCIYLTPQKKFPSTFSIKIPNLSFCPQSTPDNLLIVNNVNITIKASVLF